MVRTRTVVRVAAAFAVSCSAIGFAGAQVSEKTELVVGVPTLGSQDWTPWLATGDAEIVPQMVGETLIRTNPETGELVPGLAESWELSDDLKTWTFKLRPDVPFHDNWGTVTAEDVKFSWEQYTQENSRMSAAGSLRNAIGKDINNFEIVGPLEFRVHTPEPFVFLAGQLSNTTPGPVIQSKKYWDENPDTAARHPIGTGPFRFVSSTPDIEVRLEAVNDHWRQTPAFKSAVLKIIRDEGARLAQLRSGDIDIAQIVPALIEEVRVAGLNIVSVPDVGSTSLMFGGQYEGEPAYDGNVPWIQANAPEKGLAIRKAISLAIDRKAILDHVIGGFGELTYAPLVQYPKNTRLADSSWSLPEYDLEKARELLAEGGYPDGFEVTMPIFAQTGKPATIDIGEVIAGMLEELGLKVNRQPTDWATFRPNLVERKTTGWLYVYVTPFYPEVGQSFGISYIPSATSAQFYDAVVTEGAERLSVTGDPDQRINITREILTHLVNEVRSAPLFTFHNVYATGPAVGDWKPTYGRAELTSLESVIPSGR